MASQLLFSAVQAGDVDQVQALLVDGGADVNAINSLGETALHIAATRNNVTIMELLLEAKARPDFSTRTEVGGETPFLVAARLLHLACGKALLMYNANPNVVNSLGQTALHIASRHGSVPFVTLCLHYGANVGIVDASGRTALQWANEQRHKDVADLLVRAATAAGTSVGSAAGGTGGPVAQGAAANAPWLQRVGALRSNVVWQERVTATKKPKAKAPAADGKAKAAAKK